MNLLRDTAALLAAGWLFWTLTEYWMHRLVFHFEPEEGPGARLHWIIHGVHHDHPNDPLRLVMPPSVSVPLAAAFYGLFVLVLLVVRRWTASATSGSKRRPRSSVASNSARKPSPARLASRAFVAIPSPMTASGAETIATHISSRDLSR
jgi:hypothetical protein